MISTSYQMNKQLYLDKANKVKFKQLMWLKTIKIMNKHIKHNFLKLLFKM